MRTKEKQCPLHRKCSAVRERDDLKFEIQFLRDQLGREQARRRALQWEKLKMRIERDEARVEAEKQHKAFDAAIGMLKEVRAQREELREACDKYQVERDEAIVRADKNAGPQS